MSVHWPPLVVRTWRGALYGRSIHDWIDYDHDYAEEAIESRRMHELRGLMVGQVAEMEALLLYITSQIRNRYGAPLPNRKKRPGAGGARNDLRQLLPAVGLSDEFVEELETIKKVIDRRNKLVHGRILVGFSRVSELAPLEPVIALLFDNDEIDASLAKNDDDNAGDDSPAPSETDNKDIEFDELELQNYLNEAYVALEAALDIWEKVDEVLPSSDP